MKRLILVEVPSQKIWDGLMELDLCATSEDHIRSREITAEELIEFIRNVKVIAIERCQNEKWEMVEIIPTDIQKAIEEMK